VLTVVPTHRFLKETKLAQRRGKDLQKLEAVIVLLANGSELPQRLRDHALSGDWSHHRECHVEPDWLLIYSVAGEELRLVRTGTHADLFNR
jgi:mRNA interferase YafQ